MADLPFWKWQISESAISQMTDFQICHCPASPPPSPYKFQICNFKLLAFLLSPPTTLPITSVAHPLPYPSHPIIVNTPPPSIPPSPTRIGPAGAARMFSTRFIVLQDQQAHDSYGFSWLWLSGFDPPPPYPLPYERNTHGVTLLYDDDDGAEESPVAS